MHEFGGLECFWSDLSKHPTCPHGPTLLFGRYVNNELKQFYVCSACRDRKLCNFYAEKDAKNTVPHKKAWKAEAKKTLPPYNHRKLFIRFNEAMIESPEKRAYCHTCNQLVLFSERQAHNEHDLQTGLSDEMMRNPTTLLKPLSNEKKEAQYLFSTKAVTDITNILVKSGTKQVLCIGAPRIHEYITENFEGKISSLLLDFDGRFHNFFGPLNYCWYNLFNHHFFSSEGAEMFKDFMTQDSHKDTVVICDPPFGGRVEPISQTLKTIDDQYKKWNKSQASELRTIFVFPYFMESIMQRKSNPSNIEGGLKSLVMTDYKVDYENHPLFMIRSKHGSPVRIFTNIPLNLFELPEEDGYKFCTKCKKWVFAENKHCKKCKACTSKDGSRYRHCKQCERCVKQSWEHCKICKRCLLKEHNCDKKPRITGRCFQCGEQNHTAKDCNKENETKIDTEEMEVLPKKKRKVEKSDVLLKKHVKAKKTHTEQNHVAKNCNENKKRKINVEEMQVFPTKKRKVEKSDVLLKKHVKAKKIHTEQNHVAKNCNENKKRKINAEEMQVLPTKKRKVEKSDVLLKKHVKAKKIHTEQNHVVKNCNKDKTRKINAEEMQVLPKKKRKVKKSAVTPKTHVNDEKIHSKKEKVVSNVKEIKKTSKIEKMKSIKKIKQHKVINGKMV